MTALLADWYNEVSIGATGETIAARTAALDALVSDGLSPHQVVELVGLAYGRTEAGPDSWLRAAFKAHDQAFLMRGNDRELALLAGACLTAVCETDSALAVLAASAASVAARLGWTSAAPDLAQTAEQRLVDLGSSRRQPEPSPTAPAAAAWTKALQAAAFKKLDEEGLTDEAVRAAVNHAGAAANAAATASTQYASSVSEWAERALGLAAEETDLVAWLLSGRSDTLDAPWSSTDERSAAAIAGRELAAILAVLPAPPQADAFLHQLLAATKFAKRATAADPGPPAAPAEIAFLFDGGPTEDDAARTGQLSLRRAVLADAWRALQ